MMYSAYKLNKQGDNTQSPWTSWTVDYQAPPSMEFSRVLEWVAIAFSRYAHDTTLMAESEEELKSLLMRVKKQSEKAGLKLNIQKMKIMASSPITSRQIDGDTMESVRDFIIFLGSKITAEWLQPWN